MPASLGVVNSQHHSAAAGASSCGLLKWCYSAVKFAALPIHRGGAEVAIFTNNASATAAECAQPGVRVSGFDPELAADIETWHAAQRLIKPRKRGLTKLSFVMSTLYKWEILRHVEYRALFFSDVDVDFFLPHGGAPPPAGSPAYRALAAAWSDGDDGLYGRFLRDRRLKLVGSGDDKAPINTAVMVLKPDLDAYALGRAALRTRRFNVSTGWNASGAPKATLPFVMPRFGGGTFHLTGVRSWFANTWNYVCGDGDQGLFAHVFLVLLRGETFAMASDSRNASATTYHVSHFFGGYKPWRSLNRCRAYFDFMNASDFRHAETACVRALDEKRRCLLDGLSRAECERCRRKRQKSTCQMKAECPRGIGWRVF